MFTNDLYPRATTDKGAPKTEADWHVAPTRVKRRASIGSNATILAGVVVGENAIVGAGAVVTKDVVGAGAVVTKDVADHATVAGVPARPIDERRRGWNGRSHLVQEGVSE